MQSFQTYLPTTTRSKYVHSHELAGDYYIDFGRNRLIAHDMMHRKPSISLTVEEVLSMKLITSLEAREAYAKSIMIT